MSHGSDCQETTFAYLSTLESIEHGYFGGYLVLSKLGRPLEFHCTAPIRPSRAQQILYGPTLEPYLLGEQICGALLHAAKLKPSVILTDREAALYVRARTAAPIVLVANSTPHAVDANELQAPHDVSKANDAGARDFMFGAYELQLPFGYERDQSEVVTALTVLTQHVELAEPFERIHEAIREAQRIGGRGTEANDQAA
jgi:hypothetical protein